MQTDIYPAYTGQPKQLNSEGHMANFGKKCARFIGAGVKK